LQALGELDFKKIEQKWAGEWEKSGVYRFDESSTKPVYSIDSPPPFTSGALHMGHVLSYSYFDFASRYKRMRGFNVFYPQGWDCQGFPTEVKVEKKFGRLPRAEFKARCIEFTLENIAAMKRQMVQMGFSPDWKYEYRTMDPSYHKRVQYSLLKMYDEGQVYHAKHPVLFCTNCVSAIAKAETEEIEADASLNTIKFEVEPTGEELLIATTRPELLHACVAVVIHPEDERAAKLVGKYAKTPVFGKSVPIIAEKEVDRQFGTGVVMVCSFGDKEDVKWIYRHKLAVIESWTEFGKVVNAGEGFDGLKPPAMREKVLEALKVQDRLVKQEKFKRVIKTHDRCGKPVDFLSTRQWFVKVKDSGESIIKAAKTMRWIPDFSVQYLVDWAQFIDFDWVISRQRVYGTPLPFYYCEKCAKVYAAEYSSLPVDPAAQPIGKECECGGKILGEASTCDCWVDSSITPLSIGQWPENKALFEKVYPASLRPQGLEIIRTWAFYTIARCLALTGKPPFQDVLINGSVLGKDNKKMSKSLGNYEDPDELLKRYPADAMRQWAALSGAFARDRPFSFKDVERSQSFLVKLWNASKFVQKALEGFDQTTSISHVAPYLRATDKWLLSRANRLAKDCTRALEQYDYYSAITAVHSFFWHEFCDFYLEEVKHRVYGEAATQEEKESRLAAQFVLRDALEKTLLLLAPFAVFVTEEVHASLFPSKGSLHARDWPQPLEEYINGEAENIVAGFLHLLLGEARKFKASRGLSLNEPLSHAKITAPDTFIASFKLFEQELRQTARIAEFSLETGDVVAVEFKV